MAWDEPGNNYKPEKRSDHSHLGIVIVACFISLCMYMLGKHDGVSDTLISNPTACQTIENLEDN